MELHVDASAVTIRLTHVESLRLGVALRAGAEVSRAEYFIRTGLSKPELEEIVRALINASEGSAESLDLPLTEGVEDVENPRRPRPPTSPAP